jgi:hypothetical protein
MEWVGNLGMDMSLSVVEFSYRIFQQTSANPDSAPPQEIDHILKTIWDQDSLATHDPLDLVFPSDEGILEEMTGLDRSWDDLHHKSYFLPELKRIEEREFVTTMNRDALFLLTL